MIGLAYNAFVNAQQSGEYFTLLFFSDIIALILLCIPRDVSKQLGVGWAGVMTIGLLLSMIQIQYLGAGYFSSGALAILFLCIVELLAIIKFGYDALNEQARSWKNDSE